MTHFTRDDIREAFDGRSTVAVVLGWTDTAWSPTPAGEFTGPAIITYGEREAVGIYVAGQDYPQVDPDSDDWEDVVRALTEDAGVVLP